MRKLVLFVIPIMLLAVACSGGSKKTNPGKTPTVEPPASTAATNTRAPAATATTASQPTAAPTASSPRASTGSGASALFDTVNPFELLNGLSGAPVSGNVDPALSAVLLTSSDLPSGFIPLGDFGYNLPSSEYGPMQMAANMFASGDIMSSGDFGTMVMSAAISLPPDAIDELNSLGGFDQLANLTDADLRALQDAGDMFGMSFTEMRVLDGSDLGDGGVGMHMVMDFSGMLDAFGAPEDENPLAGGIAIDMYIFARGDHLLMTMVMWSAGDSSGVNSRNLAEALDANASGTF